MSDVDLLNMSLENTTKEKNIAFNYKVSQVLFGSLSKDRCRVSTSDLILASVSSVALKNGPVWGVGNTHFMGP